MRTCRDPYPFHRAPAYIARGIHPAPLAPRVTFMGTMGRLIGYCFAVATAAVALVGFFRP